MAKSKRKLKVWHIVVISIIVLGGIFIFQLMTIDTSNVEVFNGCQTFFEICFYQFDPIRSSIRVIDNNSEWIVSGDCVSTVGERFAKFGKENPTVLAQPPDFGTENDCLDRINFSRLHWTRQFNVLNIVGIEVEQHRFLFIDKEPQIVPLLPEMNIIGG